MFFRSNQGIKETSEGIVYKGNDFHNKKLFAKVGFKYM